MTVNSVINRVGKKGREHCKQPSIDPAQHIFVHIPGDEGSSPLDSPEIHARISVGITTILPKKILKSMRLNFVLRTVERKNKSGRTQP